MTVFTKQGPTFVVFALALALAASAFLMSPGTSVADTHDGPRVLIEPRVPDSASPGQPFSVEVWSVPYNGAESAGWDFKVGYERVHVLAVNPLVDAIGTQSHDTHPCGFAFNDHMGDDGGFVAVAMACTRGFEGPTALVEIVFETMEHVSVGESVAFDIFDSTVGNIGIPTSLIDSWGGQAAVHILGGICGDQNGDGKVNILDAIIDLKFVVGEPPPPTDLQRFLGDLDRNGEIDIIDVIIMLQHLVGLLDIAQIGCGPMEHHEGSIYGYKFNDPNMNGLVDDGESRMSGWTIQLLAFQEEEDTFVIVDETVTMEDDLSTPDRDETGFYWFDGLHPGEYVVREERRDGWEQSWPPTAAAWMGGDQEVDQVETDAGGRAAIDLVRSTVDGAYWIKFGVEFGGLSSPATALHIHVGEESENGEVLYDLVESSPSVSPGFEDQVSGMFRLVDNPRQSDLSIQEQIILLLNRGLYVNLHSEDHPGGEIRGQISSMNNRHHITLSPGEEHDLEGDFSNYEHPADTPGRILAIKFEDLNGNGVLDPGEPRLADVAIELFDSNGEHIETVRTMEDDPDSFGREEGRAHFFDLTPDTYTLREVVPDGWGATTPTEVEVDVPPGTVKVVFFGNCLGQCQEPLGDTYTIEGIKFEDRNGNGQRDNDEPGVSGVHIQVLDSGGNLVEEKWTDGDDPGTPNDDETGRFRFVDLAEGEYTVREILQEGWESTTPEARTVNVGSHPEPMSSHGEFGCDHVLFVANEGNGGGGQTIAQVDCYGNVSTYTGGFDGVSGLTGASSGPHDGQTFASDDRQAGQNIYHVDLGTGNVDPILSGSSAVNPNTLSWDSSGRMLVGDAGHRILRLSMDSSFNLVSEEVLAEGFSVPQGVVEDPVTKNVYFTDSTGFVYLIHPTDTLPVTTATVSVLPIGSVAPSNEGNLVMDGDGNLYLSDFNNRIIKVEFTTPRDASTAQWKDVVAISEASCPPDQAGRAFMPGFRGLLIPNPGAVHSEILIVTGYCEDKIGIFQAADLQSAWDTDIPITSLPAPFAENPGSGLDGILDGPFGMVLQYVGDNWEPGPDTPYIEFGNRREEEEGCSCIIGIFEEDQTHDWWVRSNPDPDNDDGGDRRMIKVVASTVSDDETGSITVTIFYGNPDDPTTVTDTVTVDHTGSDSEHVGWLDVDTGRMAFDENYLMRVTYSGNAPHYKLGWKPDEGWRFDDGEHGPALREPYLHIGTNDIKYNEAVNQVWVVKANKDEEVTLEFWTDTANNGADQASEITVEVRGLPDGTPVLGPQTIELEVDNGKEVKFTVPHDGWYGVFMGDMENPGHYRVVRRGDNGLLWLWPCIEDDDHEDSDTIRGMKFVDLNGNGQRDNDEPGMPGVEIQVLDSNGNLVDSAWTWDDDDQTSEDEAGWFRFGGLHPGVYTVKEIVPEGWEPTTPLELTVSIDDDSQDPIYISFGNWMGPQ